MRRYETFVILDPDLSEDLRRPVIERAKDVMAQMGGTLLRVEEWGSRRLAYTIRKKERGYYVRLDFCGSGQLVGEMERFFRIDERVLKHMSVLLDSEPNVERIQEEMAKAEAAAQKPSETAATITPAAAAAAPESAEPAPQAAAPQPIVPADSQQEA
ncbi:MAG: 30S ribosomal protein S6 [Desulfobacterales bacterium]|jgi:small subunit ribosomal protein S6|nr:30S ribosomal protein S6 [Desulfobacterales bacterium]